MKPLLTAAQSREVDARAIACGISGAVLMENAGRGAAELLRAQLAGTRSTLVVAGAGNNGGDGYVLARHLHHLGEAVHVVAAAEPAALTGDARAAHAAYTAVGGAVTTLEQLEARLADASWIVDGLLGTWLTRPVVEPLAAIIRAINHSGRPVFSLDLPSGLHADTGAALGETIVATRTATFHAVKCGLATPNGRRHAGIIDVVSIGLPAGFAIPQEPAAWLFEAADAAATLEPRPVDVHKGRAGRVALGAGSAGTIGAALLAARGALRAGAGLVTVHSSADLSVPLASHLPEAMAAPLESLATSPARVLALGPGLGLQASTVALVAQLAANHPGPMVLDADALTALAQLGLPALRALLKDAPGPRALTPHAGELARLTGRTVDVLEADRLTAARDAADEFGATVLYKGRHTVVATPGRTPWIIDAGHPVLAVGGTGDVLTGVLAAFAVELPLHEAAALAAHLHGAAGERWAANHGSDRGLLAHELADLLPQEFGALLAQRRLRVHGHAPVGAQTR